jgi:UDP-N-acetylmuramate dehydrogenase
MMAFEPVVEALRTVPGLRPWCRAPVAPFTTMGVGGRAAVLLSVSNTEALVTALGLLHDSSTPWAVLGAGSNVLVPDGGFPGVLVTLDEGFHFVQGPEELPGSEHTRVVAGAKLPLARLAAHLAEIGQGGLEFACGIPGSVGGGVVMNAGAHGSCMADVVDFVEVAGQAGAAWIPASELVWEYRACHLPEGVVVTAASFRLRPTDPGAAQELQRAYLQTRRRTQPRGVRTFGSTFKNPAGDSAGRLLEVAGMKGVRRGGAQVSPVHANFIANLGDASATDVVALMGMMRDTVRARLGVELETEVRLLAVSR